jgi:hypothetical protein
MQPAIGTWIERMIHHASLRFQLLLITRRQAFFTFRALILHSSLRQGKPSSFDAAGAIDPIQDFRNSSGSLAIWRAIRKRATPL